ncbi:MAG: ligase-associated DNA damage response endonuclease PdeM [Candidatus Hydrogenedentes bacterium]|nr:ligase-associated DNA damage response endonuclease PdeM [Candidatus Hydrogenedentota bacterium]
MNGAHEIEVAGEKLRLLAAPAVYWPAQSTLLAADLHFGKAAWFRAQGFPVPRGTTGDTLERLANAVSVTDAKRLVILGDLLHARQDLPPALIEDVARWRRNTALEVIVVRGNHDRRAGDPPAAWDMSVVDEPWMLGPFALCHYPRPVPEGYALAGHLHPVVRLQAAGHDRVKLQCFWFGDRVGVLPAFGGFTGSAIIQPQQDDRVYVVADDAVLRVHC